MAAGRSTSASGDLRTLWTAGAVGEADDASLIERFSAARDDAGESAFRVLVERHGPMVRRVCHQILGDGHEAQDAAQAVFLVLARKAGSIRVDGTVGPWLHGVARRVAVKARVRGSARRDREERSAVAVAERRERDDGDRDGVPDLDWALLHEEVDRLPAKSRVPVVLCYLEGLTYEAAALRIGCPVGTVRVRLSRARDRLRDRLSRRGFGPAGLTAFAGIADAPPAAAAFGGLSSNWVDATVHAAQAVATGRAVAGTVSAAALTLSREVVRSMLYTKLKVAGVGLLSVAVLAAGGRGLVGQGLTPREAGGPGPSQKVEAPKPEAAKSGGDPARPTTFLEAARKRLEAQRAFYEEGRITIDRYLDASDQVAAAETLAAKTEEARSRAASDNLARLEECLAREKAELNTGRGTVADVAEAAARVEQARVALVDVTKARFARQDAERQASIDKLLGARVETLDRRLQAVEAKLDRLMKSLDGQDKQGTPPASTRK